MREFKKCPQCGMIDKTEIMLRIPAMAALIKPEWVCKCTAEAETELRDSLKVYEELTAH